MKGTSLLKAVAIMLLVGLIMPRAARAHHSTAMFDHSKAVTLKGKVVQFNWVNPHSVLYLEVEEPNGEKPQTWAIEML